MGGNLKNAVSRCIYNQVSCAQMFLAIFVYYNSAGIWFVAYNIFAGKLFVFFNDISRESVRINRERIFTFNTCNLPVAYCGILSVGSFSYSCKTCGRKFSFCTAKNIINVENTEVVLGKIKTISDLLSARNRICEASKRM